MKKLLTLAILLLPTLVSGQTSAQTNSETSVTSEQTNSETSETTSETSVTSEQTNNEQTNNEQNALIANLLDIDEDASWFERFIAYEAERILQLDPYGVTAQMPQGWLKIKWDTGFIEAGHRYNRFGELGPVFAPLSFESNGEQVIEADLGFGGTGHGYTLQMSYGLFDRLNWYVEHTWTFQHVTIDPSLATVDEDGNYIHPGYASFFDIDDPQAYDSEEFLYNTFPMLGRPTPDTEYNATWMRGDVNTGFSWNFFRNERMSAAITPRIFIPTGYVPDPNSSIFYGTGPALESSVGGWMTSVTQGLDFRLLRLPPWIEIIASTETTLGYAFKQERPYPTNFLQPDPLAQQIDPSAFPDLSELEGTFDYTPGISVDWYAKTGFQFGPLGLSAGYGLKYSQEPLMGSDTDPNFQLMVDSLEIMGSQTQHLVQVGASLSLLPLRIPGNIGASYTEAIGGQNAIVFDNYWIINAELFFPIFALWNPRPWERD